MRQAAEEERFEEAARYRNRLFSVRHLAERQAADKRAVGTIDVIGIAIEGDRATVQIFPLRDGKLIDRYSFHLENVEGQDLDTVLEAFVLEYYGSAPSVPPQIVVPAWRGGRGCAGGVPLGAARIAGRGAQGGARREAAAPGARDRERAAGAEVGGCRDGAEAAAAGRGARGAPRGAQPREPAAADRVLRRLEHPGGVAGRLDGRLPGRRREEGALPEVRDQARRGPGRLRGAGRGDHAAVRPDARRRGRGVRRVVRGNTEPRGRRRRQGTALGGARGDAGVRPAPRGRDLARQAGRGGLRPGPARADRARPARARAPAAPADPRRGAPVRARLPPAAARLEGEGVDLRHAARASARPGGARSSSTSARPSGSSPRRRRSSRACPGMPQKTARSIYAQLHKAGRA